MQHAWTYKPLAHDVLGMRLNRITVAPPAPKAGQPPLMGASAQSKSFEVTSHRSSLPECGFHANVESVIRSDGGVLHSGAWYHG